jgi:NifB/MoaA-like Fe-S oxidoreductase
MLGVLDRFPRLATVGVVPLGVSAHSNEPEMSEHTRAEARAVVDIVERWQERFVAGLGRRLVYVSDEYYLLAGRPFPALDAYDGCPQHENGIGMARTFESEARAALAGTDVEPTGVRSGFFAWVDGAPADGYRAPTLSQQIGRSARLGRAERPNTTQTFVLTGELGAPVLEPLLADLPGAPKLLTVPNRFFGGNIGVTGLLTGADVAAALTDAPDDARYLLPDVVLSRGKFLDGTTVAALPRRVEIVPTDGASLVKALAR